MLTLITQPTLILSNLLILFNSTCKDYTIRLTKRQTNIGEIIILSTSISFYLQMTFSKMKHLLASLLFATGFFAAMPAATQPFGRQEPPKQTHELKCGDLTLGLDAERGGKILSFKYKDTEIISQSRFPESFGSTFWTSPQKEWNWPPVKEFDKGPYKIEQQSDTRLVLVSEVSERMKYRIRKDINADAKNKAFVITYSIVNESDETRQVAPWEITRVTNENGLIFFEAPLDGITPAGLMSFKEDKGAVWYQTDEAPENRKVNADGKGWLAYSANGLLLIKKFEDLTPAQPAPGEAEVQVMVSAARQEFCAQGAFETSKESDTIEKRFGKQSFLEL